MARYTGADCRLCRREGAKLFLKEDVTPKGADKVMFVAAPLVVGFITKALPPGTASKLKLTVSPALGLKLLVTCFELQKTNPSEKRF